MTWVDPRMNAGTPSPTPDYSMPGYSPLTLAPPPAVLSKDVDQQRQFYRPGVSQYRISPLPPKQNLAQNAATQSIAANAAGAAVEKIAIGLTAPKEIIVTGSPAGPKGNFLLEWAPENEGWIFGVTPINPALGNIVDVFQTGTALNTDSGSTSSITIGAAPTNENEWALLLVADGNVGYSTPTGWATEAWNPPLAASLLLNNTDPFTVTASTPTAGINATAAGLILFGNVNNIVPVLAQTASTNNLAVQTVTTSHDTIPGNTLIVVVSGTLTSHVGQIVDTPTDSQGNTYFPILSVVNTGATSPVSVNGCQLTVWAATNIAGGPCTITFVYGSLVLNGVQTVAEYSGIHSITSPTGIPHFLPFVNIFTVLFPPGASGNVLTSDGTSWSSQPPSGGSPPFSDITSGTNTTAAMVVGSGASLGRSGTGTIDASAIDGVAVTGTPSIGDIIVATSPTAATWQPASSSSGGDSIQVNGVGVSDDFYVTVNYVNGIPVPVSGVAHFSWSDTIPGLDVNATYDWEIDT